MTVKNKQGRKVGHPFYGSAKWKKVRATYLETKHWICEKCGRPANVVHHIEHLTEKDYFVNYDKCYGFDNLMALCRECHDRMPDHFLARIGKQNIADGYEVDMVTGEVRPVAYPPKGVWCDSPTESR